jgi:LmbE family N-acetylglucosaminyl deacetylase/ActR/RegA family two-component response regulator
VTPRGESAAREAGVLLVEDDEIMASALAVVLAAVGEVRWTATAEEAITLVPARDWDLIVADIELPGMNGLDLIRWIRGKDETIATLVLSGHASFDFAVAAMRVGADDYMRKPVEPADLISKARELIALTGARRRRGGEVVLAVGAHPDDVEIGIGGLLLRHVAAGDAVTVLTLTEGTSGGAAAERLAESQRAADLLSARLVHADLPDTTISEGGATIATIKRVIDEIAPTTLYTHTINDVHQDHRNVHSASLVAARRVPKVFCYESPSTTVEFHPTRFVAIDEYLERKIEVIHAYASQVKIRDYLDEELLRATARYWGRYSQARYVEPLEVVRDSDARAAGSARESSPVMLPQEANVDVP